MKRLILHIGAHRAGSTTIQHLLCSRSDALRREGIAVLTRSQLMSDRWLAPLAVARGGILSTLAGAAVLHRLRGEVAVVSEENMLGLMPGHRPEEFYAQHRTALRNFALWARWFAISLRWIVRRQDRFLESVYAFRISRGTTEDFATFCGRLHDRLHWLRLAQSLARLQRCDLRIGLFEDVIAGESAPRLTRFLGLPGDADLWGATLRRRNFSVSGPMLSFMRGLWLYDPSINTVEQRKAVATVLERHKDSVLPPLKEMEQAFDASPLQIAFSQVRAAHAFAAKAPEPKFDARQRRALLDHYAEENRRLMSLPCIEGHRDLWELTTR